MRTLAVLGIDIGKSTFHMHGQDADGNTVLQKKVTRSQLTRVVANVPRCVIVMEACAGSHYQARALAALGHEVRLIAAQYVRPFVRRNKNDFIDAEALCEAAARPSMRFVVPKNEQQQLISSLHGVRETFVRDRVAVGNQIHGILLEFGIALPRGKTAIRELSDRIDQLSVPPGVRDTLRRLCAHMKHLRQQADEIEQELKRLLAQDDAAMKLQTIPGIGPIVASALSAEVACVRQYRHSRDFAASVGLTPRQYSTGGRPKLLGISKRGDRRLRWLFVQAARSVLQRADRRNDALGRWIQELRLRRHSNVVACAIANKLARIAWAVLTRGIPYTAPQGVA